MVGGAAALETAADGVAVGDDFLPGLTLGSTTPSSRSIIKQKKLKLQRYNTSEQAGRQRGIELYFSSYSGWRILLM
jgi:hypothetical protein